MNIIAGAILIGGTASILAALGWFVYAVFIEKPKNRYVNRAPVLKDCARNYADI